MPCAIFVRSPFPGVTAAVITMLGCADPTPTSPERADVAAANSAVADAADSDARASLGAAVDDALSRVLPTLGRSDASAQLLSALEVLHGSVSFSGTSIAASVLKARRALALLEARPGNDAGVAAELSALGLVLDRAAELDP